jgi:type I restriction enzyme S subunit
MKYPRYPKYKDSGVDWIGEIPEHWNVIKLKYVIENFVGGGTPSTGVSDYWADEGGIHWVAISDITGSDEIDDTKRKITVSGLNSKSLTLLPPGTIVYSMYASVGKVSKLLITAATNQAILGLINRENLVLNDYLKFSLESFEPFIGFLFSSNTQNNISEEKVKNIVIPLTDLNSQAEIIRFLSIKSALIDILIFKTEKMIQVLKEKRQAIITHAVTKGLDPNVPMKDSGVEWIGEIPEHWNVQKLKRTFQVLNGSTPRSDNSLYWNGKIIWVTPEDLRLTVSPIIFESSRQITSEGYDSCGTNLVPKGSIIVSTRAPIGYVKIAGVELCTNQGCRSLVKKTKSNEKYFFYYLSCFASVLNSFGQGSTFVELSSENLKMFQATIPPIGEQISITRFLDSETNKIDGLIAKNLKLIDLLREFKTSLITQAVTGKIDVRGFTAPTKSDSTGI